MDCEAAQQRTRTRRNPAAQAAASAKWYAKPEVKARMAARWKVYYAAHREEILARVSSPVGRSQQTARLRSWRSKNPEKDAANFKRWCPRYPEKVRARSLKWAKTPLGRLVRQAAEHRRQSLKRSLPVTLTHTDIAVALEWFGHACAYYGVVLYKYRTRTLDHVVPLSRRGPTTPCNIVPACRSCNSSKNDKDLKVWLRSRKDLDGVGVIMRVRRFFRHVSRVYSPSVN